MAMPITLRARNLLEATVIPALRRALLGAVSSPLGQRGVQAAGRLAERWPGLTQTIATIVQQRMARGSGRSAAQAPAPAPPKPAPAAAATPVATPAPEPVDELHAALEQLGSAEDFNERVKAVHALGTLGGQDAESALVAALRDPAVEVAVAAVAALGASDSRNARSALVQLIEQRDGYTSPATRVAALGALAGREPGRVLSAVSDLDQEVSLAAIGLLSGPTFPLEPSEVQRCLSVVAEDQSGFYSEPVQTAARNALGSMPASN